MREGVWGVLESTATAHYARRLDYVHDRQGPGRDGILDFEKYDATTHTLTSNSTYEIRDEDALATAERKGLRRGSLNCR